MQLPRSVKEIADVLGEERALFLIGKLPRCYNGGQFHVILYVPTVARLTMTHELVKILGWADAVKLCQAFGGEILHPAPCASIYMEFRNENIVRMIREGIPHVMVAEWFGLKPRQVQNLTRHVIPQEECKLAAAQNRASTTTKKRTRYEQVLQAA